MWQALGGEPGDSQQTKGFALDIRQLAKVKDVENTKENKAHRMCTFVKTQLIVLDF